MRATPDPVADGQELVYTIEVTNAGPGIAIAPSLHQQLPAGTGFSTADPECSYSAFEHGVDCDLADIDPGQSRTIDVRVIAGEPAEGPGVGVWLSGAIEGSGPPAVFLLDGSSADRKAISTADLLVVPHGLARESEGGLVVRRAPKSRFPREACWSTRRGSPSPPTERSSSPTPTPWPSLRGAG